MVGRVAVLHLSVSFFTIAAEVVIHAAAAMDRSSAAVIEGHRCRKIADVGGSLDEDRVRSEQGVVFLDHRLKLGEEFLTLLDPAAGEVSRDANEFVASGRGKGGVFAKN